MNDRLLDVLMDAWRDSRISETEMATLNDLLRTSESARKRFREEARFHGQLHTAVLAAAVSSAIDSSTKLKSPNLTKRARLKPSMFRQMNRPSSLLLAAASFALIVGAGVWWLPLLKHDKASQIGPVVADVGDSRGVTLSYKDGHVLTPQRGTALHAAAYELQAGVLEVTYANGAEVLIQGPATFILANNKIIELQRGRLTAHIPETATGFTVETPTASVVDIGTDFGVFADHHASEVHVFKGEVLVKSQRQADPVVLKENRASRIDMATGTPTGIDISPQRFVRSLSESTDDFANAVRELKPLAYYPMSSLGDGTTLVNAMTNGLNGKIVAQSGRSLFEAGRNGGMSFNLGGAESMVYGYIPNFPRAKNEQLTVGAWVIANRRSRWATIVKNWSKEREHDEGGQFHFGLFGDDGDLEVHVHDREYQEVQLRENVPLPLGQWHFVAFTMDGTTLRLYRNGNEIASTACNGLSQFAPSALGVGVKLDGSNVYAQARTGGFWDGRLDDIVIFHRALTADQLKTLHQ